MSTIAVRRPKGLTLHCGLMSNLQPSQIQPGTNLGQEDLGKVAENGFRNSFTFASNHPNAQSPTRNATAFDHAVPAQAPPGSTTAP